MSNRLAQALNKATNVTLTENGALTNKSTNSCVLDLFSQIGAYRSGKVSPRNRIKEFRNALAEDKRLTTKMLFWVRDIRGGQGEREVFRVFLVELAKTFPEIVIANLENVPFYGRWDDLLCLRGTPVESQMLNLIKKQLSMDLTNANPSLLGKWLPSINTSSKKTVEMAKWLCRSLEMNPVSYRRMLSSLRKRVNVLERALSRNEWSKVDYERVSSNASLKYRKAFKKHDLERYAAYLAKVEKGEKKIKAATLYPYEIIGKIQNSSYLDNTVELLWKALPDYYNGREENALVVCDVSGSMVGMPLNVSTSLAIYMAERNKGPWHNKFITFSAHPVLQSLVGLTLRERFMNLCRSQWDMNTNVHAVFKLILSTALREKLTSDELPNRIYIISDMEFDGATGRQDKTLFRKIQEEFESHNYTMPQLVFWNVAARNKQFPMSMDDRGFLNVSGCSPSILKSLLKGAMSNAYEAMVETLEDERYNRIVV